MADDQVPANSDGSDTPAADDKGTLMTPADDKPADDKPADDKPADDKPADDKPAGEGAPEEYAEFTMPEGLTIDADLLGQAAPLFKKMGLSQEDAQALVDLQASGVQKYAQEQSDAATAQISTWEADAKADKEIGGEAFDENIGTAKLALEKVGTPELTKFLTDSGAGSHPEVIRAFVKMGKLLKEDDPGGSSAEGGSAPQDRVARMYPNNNK